MQRRPLHRTIRMAACAAVLWLICGAAQACPFCQQGLSVTWGEQLSLADVAAIVEKLPEGAGGANVAGQARFKVVEVLRGPEELVSVGAELSDDSERSPVKEGAREMWCGRVTDGALNWTAYVPMTDARLRYVTRAPSRLAPATERLPYYVRHLGAVDTDLGNDAYAEIAAASYADVKTVAKSFPREKLRDWLADPKPRHPERRGLYALMLGLCGDADDAVMLRGMALEPVSGFPLGLDGVVAAWLLLTGAEGLAEVETQMLGNADADDSATFAAVKALRFMWTYGEGAIAPARLQAAMRRLIDRPRFSETAIKDLARWKDWSLHERLMRLYDAADYNLPSTRRAIIGYMIASTKDAPAGQPAPAHAEAGARCLARLREKDPKRVAEVEAYWMLAP